MSTEKSAATLKTDRIIAEAQRSREAGYRDKALKMYPHVCGRCNGTWPSAAPSEQSGAAPVPDCIRIWTPPVLPAKCSASEPRYDCFRISGF